MRSATLARPGPAIPNPASQESAESVHGKSMAFHYRQPGLGNERQIAMANVGAGGILHGFGTRKSTFQPARPVGSRLKTMWPVFCKEKTCKPTAPFQAAAACKPEQPPITMKLIPTLSCFSLALLLSATAQVKETTTEKTTKTNADGTVEETTTTTTTFNPEVQTKVVKYFDTYKTLPYGLPPEWSTRMKIKEIPTAWRTARVAPGTVFAEDVRPFLLEAPPALVKVLPPPTAEVRYYVAGGSVVAIDKTYKVVDSIQIPTVKFEVEVDDDEIKVKKKEKDD